MTSSHPEPTRQPSIGAAGPPSLADVGRLGRRPIRAGVGAARKQEVPTFADLLSAHLNPSSTQLPVVTDSWPGYEHVNLQMALDQWLGEAGRTHVLVGVSQFAHRLVSLGDMAQSDGEQFGPRVGGVAMTEEACGPGGAMRSCVRSGLYLITEGDRRLAVLLFRNEQGGHSQQTVSLDVLCEDPAGAASLLANIRSLTTRHNVFRGHVLSLRQRGLRPPADRSALRGPTSG